MMTEKELLELTDEELLAEAKKNKSTKTTDALLIGFSAGIIIYSILNHSLGFLTLIPLLFAFKLINKPKNDEIIEKLLKERNLK